MRSSHLLGISVWTDTMLRFLIDLESDWQANLIQGTVFWYKQTKRIHLRTAKTIMCSCILESSNSGKHPEGYVRQMLKLWMLQQMDNTPRYSNTPSKKFCSLSSKMQVLPSVRSCQFAEAPAGVRVLLIHQMFPSKNLLWFGWEQSVKRNHFLWTGNAAFGSPLLMMRHVNAFYLLCIASLRSLFKWGIQFLRLYF